MHPLSPLAIKRNHENHEIEARKLIKLATAYKNPSIALTALNKIIERKRLSGKEYSLAFIFGARTGFIHFQEFFKPEFPELMRDDFVSQPSVYSHTADIATIDDEKGVILVRWFVDDKLNGTYSMVKKIASGKDEHRWHCQKCGNYFDKIIGLMTEDAIKKLLRNFATGKYWECRWCKTPNYFEINNLGITFKTSVV